MHRKQAMTLVSKSPEETRAIGRKLGVQLSARDLIGLIGELGTGKTVLTQGICDGLGVKDAVKSPSYIIITQYHGLIPVYHFDLYRIQSVDEFLALGYEEYFYGDGATIIEWAEKVDSLLPQDRIEVHLSFANEQSRELTIETFGTRSLSEPIG